MHIKCNKINIKTNKCLQKSPSVWYCIKCFEDIVPFGTFSNEELFKTNQRFKVKFTNFAKKHAYLTRISSINLMELWMTLHLKQFPANIYWYIYCQLSYILNNSKNYLYFFHLIISSLSFHIEELITFCYFWSKRD